MKRLHGVSILLLVIATALVGCASAAPGAATRQDGQQEPVARKRIVAAVRGDPAVLSSDLSSAGAGTIYGVTEIESLLNVGLQRLDARATLIPILAEAVPTTENGLWEVFPDGRMKTTWNLKPNVVWHDGTSFATEDLLFTLLVQRDADLLEWKTSAHNDFGSAEAPDAATLVVHWTRPYIDANNILTKIHPRHVLEPTYLENKAGYNSHPHWSEAYVGLGPFVLREFVRGSHLQLQANERYVLGRPKLDEIEVKFLQDANALAANILAGAVEVSLAGSNMTLEHVAQIRERGFDGEYVPILYGTGGVFPQFIDPNPRVITDVSFRRAVLIAIDRQSLVDNLQYGLTRVAHSNVLPDDKMFKYVDPRIVKYPHDQRQAIDLIQGLGHTRGQDGTFRNAAGQPLNVELRSTPGREVNEKVALSVAEMWKQVGIGVEINVLSLALNSDREYRATKPAFEVVGQPTGAYRFHSREMPTAATRFVGDNRMRYSNPVTDDLADRFLITIPEAERGEVAAQLWHHVTENVVMLTFFHEATQRVRSKRVLNITEPLGWNAHLWDVAQ
jgi:peptide/nickel transport system substrate-binding protein